MINVATNFEQEAQEDCYYGMPSMKSFGKLLLYTKLKGLRTVRKFTDLIS